MPDVHRTINVRHPTYILLLDFGLWLDLAHVRRVPLGDFYAICIPIPYIWVCDTLLWWTAVLWKLYDGINILFKLSFTFIFDFRNAHIPIWPRCSPICDMPLNSSGNLIILDRWPESVGWIRVRIKWSKASWAGADLSLLVLIQLRQLSRSGSGLSSTDDEVHVNWNVNI